MKEIEDLRKEIDLIDREMASYFSKRMDLCLQIGELKTKNNIKIRNPEREKQVVSTNVMYVKEDYKKYYETLITTIMSLSRKAQERNKKKKK